MESENKHANLCTNTIGNLFTIKVVALFEGDPNGVGKAWYPLYEGGFAKGVPNKYEGDNVYRTLRI